MSARYLPHFSSCPLGWSSWCQTQRLPLHHVLAGWCITATAIAVVYGGRNFRQENPCPGICILDRAPLKLGRKLWSVSLLASRINPWRAHRGFRRRWERCVAGRPGLSHLSAALVCDQVPQRWRRSWVKDFLVVFRIQRTVASRWNRRIFGGEKSASWYQRCPMWGMGMSGRYLLIGLRRRGKVTWQFSGRHELKRCSNALCLAVTDVTEAFFLLFSMRYSCKNAGRWARSVISRVEARRCSYSGCS